MCLSTKLNSQYIYLSLILTLSFLSLSSYSYGQFAQSWINFNQTYFKIPVIEDGIYRITAEDLNRIGINGINPQRLQIFHRGQEQAIWVEGEADGSLDANDYIEFYGQRNDGNQDRFLYNYTGPSFGDLVNPYYNLYSDTTAYFLTWRLDGQTGRRMNVIDPDIQGGFINYQWHEALNVFSSDYSLGQNYPLNNSAEYYLSKADDGEGWTGPTIITGRTFNTDIPIENLVVPPSANTQRPLLEIALVGGSLGVQDFQAEISITSPAGATRVVGIAAHKFVDRTTFTANLEYNDLQGTGNLRVSIRTTQGTVRTVFVRLVYPQAYTLSLEPSTTFGVPINPSNTSFVEIPNPSPAVAVFDISDPNSVTRLNFINAANTIQVSVPGTANLIDVGLPFTGSNILVLNQTPRRPIRIEPVTFQNINPQNFDYLIISHPVLRRPFNDYSDVIQSYANYRASAVGGGYRPLVVNIDVLYNQFNYGEKSPLAITRFADFMFRNGDPRYIFIIGSSLTLPDRNFNQNSGAGSNFINVRTDPRAAEWDLVPSAGFPPSDIALVTDIGNQRRSWPAIPIGRIPALNPEQVAVYLEKVIEHETLPPQLWQKNIIHLGGGNTRQEQSRFRGYLTSYQSIAEGRFLNGRVSFTGKSTTSPVEIVNISELVNDGVGLITFFGHSSLGLTDVEIGNATDDIQGYRNKGRYPLILTNGCQLGAIFYTQKTLAEDWIFAKDRGAVGFIAHCFLGFENRLREYSLNFYRVAYSDESRIGLPIGDVMQETIKDHVNLTQVLNLSNAEQMILQGDPAVRFFNAQLPDYEVNNEGISLESFNNQAVSAVSDAIQVNIVVSNPGIVDPQSRPLQVRLVRRYPNGETQTLVEEFDIADFDFLGFRDTLSITLPREDGREAFGTNFIEVSLDFNQNIPEEREDNNTAFLEVFLPSVGVIPVTPVEYAIVNTATVKLSALSTNLGQEARAIIYEVDTTHLFNSPAKRSITLPPASVTNWEYGLVGDDGRDSTVYFWRVNYADAVNDPNVLWGESSFTYIPNSPEGWTQRRFEQFSDSKLSNLSQNISQERWDFTTFSELDIQVNTYGSSFVVDNPNFAFIRVDGDPYATPQNCPSTSGGGILAMRFNAQGQIIPLFNGTECGRNLQVNFFSNADINANNNILRDYFNISQESDYLLLVAVGEVSFDSWPESIKTLFNSIGANPFIVNSLGNGYPYAILGQKGRETGTASEVTAFTIANPTGDFIQMDAAITDLNDQGILTSSVIGPSNAWREVFNNVNAESTDNYNFDLRFFNPDASPPIDTVIRNITSPSYDIRDVNAERFPYLEIGFNTRDNEKNTPAQIRNWLVQFDGLPDGFVDVDEIGRSAYIVSDLLAGETLELRFAFRNITALPFEEDSLFVRFFLNDNSDTLIQIPAPAPGEVVIFDYSLDTRGRGGDNELRMEVNPQFLEAQVENEQINPEVNFANNVLIVPFRVLIDNNNPVLEVAFDGRQILDGDIVSPDPMVSVILRDDSRAIIPQNDTTLTISYKQNCDGCEFQTINVNESDVSWVSKEGQVQVDFQLLGLENGSYAMRVQGSDAFGNRAGEEPYLINFEVVNESSITNFYPYPNPFSTSTRFVFTLTGRDIPEDIKIQIMTVSGRVVREITRAELGPIRIGNNLTEYAWDGRDEFGDELANGVYLYRVLIRGENQNFEHRSTSADKAFRQGFGKMYILR